MIPVGIIKAAGELMVLFLHSLFNTAHSSERVPSDWTRSHNISLMFKNKGRQGNVLSLSLFITYLDTVMKKTPQPEDAECFVYAVDIVQTAVTNTGMENIRSKWKEALISQYGLKLSVGKTEYRKVHVHQNYFITSYYNDE